MKLYLAGPMAGYPDHNYPKFFKLAEELRTQGHTVLNPAEINSDFANVGREVCMRRDIEAVLVCEGVFFMKGWNSSAGATCEWQIANQIGLIRIYEPGAHVPDEDRKQPDESKAYVAYDPTLYDSIHLNHDAIGRTLFCDVEAWRLLPAGTVFTWPMIETLIAYGRLSVRAKPK